MVMFYGLGGLTAKPRANIERVQKRAFRIIYPGEDYEHVLQKNEFITLEERRKAHCVKLVSDMAQEDHKLNHLLPPLKRGDRRVRIFSAHNNWWATPEVSLLLPYQRSAKVILNFSRQGVKTMYYFKNMHSKLLKCAK